jgi:uncharacterized phage protein (TIGR01671 family)
MSREIKLRAWDPQEEVMIYPLEDEAFFSIDNKGITCYRIFEKGIEGGGETDYVLDTEEVKDVIIMQFTGLKDVNDNEVYEGDAVMIKDNTGDEYIYIIKFMDDIFCFVGDGGPGEWLVLEELVGCLKIGNIYQNPELLKQ